MTLEISAFGNMSQRAMVTLDFLKIVPRQSSSHSGSCQLVAWTWMRGRRLKCSCSLQRLEELVSCNVFSHLIRLQLPSWIWTHLPNLRRHVRHFLMLRLSNTEAHFRKIEAKHCGFGYVGAFVFLPSGWWPMGSGARWLSLESPPGCP